MQHQGFIRECLSLAANYDDHKSAKYADLDTVYAQCSGPGGLKLAEFIADKLTLKSGNLLLDIGVNRGYQTCFLAREYGVFAVGVDPWNDRSDPGLPHVEFLMRNARSWGVQDRVLGIKVGVPDTGFADGSFDAAYSTTTFEMIRGFEGEEKYRECLSEVLRVLRPGGLFGFGEPMHLNAKIPSELVPIVTRGKPAWVDFLGTVQETVEAFRTVGFQVLEADYAPDARLWWEEYCQHDPGCRTDPDGDPLTLRVDDGRWFSFGYVIARKPG